MAKNRHIDHNNLRGAPSPNSLRITNTWYFLIDKWSQLITWDTNVWAATHKPPPIFTPEKKVVRSEQVPHLVALTILMKKS